jgi:hypothetical protein
MKGKQETHAEFCQGNFLDNGLEFYMHIKSYIKFVRLVQLNLKPNQLYPYSRIILLQ